MACSDGFNPETFSWMMEQRDKMDPTKESVHNASVAVGKKLANEYIYSKLDMTKEPQIEF